MGTLLYWQRPTADANWTHVKIERSDDGVTGWAQIIQVAITDTTYYDEEGTSLKYYRIRFYNSATLTHSDYSPVTQGKDAHLYANVTDVIRLCGFDPDDLPGELTENDVYDFIWNISRSIDNFRKTVYGRTETFTNKIYSSRYMDLHRILQLKHTDIDSSQPFTVERKLGDSTWQTMNFEYDYDIEYAKGHVIFYFKFVYTYKAYNDLRISGTYGNATIPDYVKDFATIMSAIRCFIKLTGGSFDDVTSYAQGSFQYSLGEPYVNMKETIKMLEKEKERVLQENGWGDARQHSVRMA